VVARRLLGQQVLAVICALLVHFALPDLLRLFHVLLALIARLLASVL